MTPSPTTQEIEALLRPLIGPVVAGRKTRGCHGPLEAYAYEVQKAILEPLLASRGAAGLVAPLDDLGHDTSFAAAWNRAISGAPAPWDSRVLADVFVGTAISEVPDVIEKLMTGDLAEIDAAILANLPGYLAGAGMPLTSGASLKSWVDGTYVHVSLDGIQARLADKDGNALGAAARLLAYFDVDFDREIEPFEFYGTMSFHAPGIDHSEAEMAESAWRSAAEANKLLHRGLWDSMMSLTMRSIMSARALNVTWQQLRQDEAISVDAGPSGLVVYRGEVEGLKTLVDEGRFLAGPRSAFVKVLEDGGFSRAGAGHYLDRLAATRSAFTATVPGASVMRVAVDPETLYALDMPRDNMIHDIRKDEAMPIMAVGTFAMPRMTTHRDRLHAGTSDTAEMAP